MLADRGRCRLHARALRSLLQGSSLRLVLHAPDDLSAGTSEHDRSFDGMLDYAAEVGAELIAYHGLNFADAEGPARARIRERGWVGEDEERSLCGLLQRAHTLGVTIAIENLAPVHPAPPRLCHDPIAVRDFVRRLDSPAAGMLLDIGHLHITADTSHTDIAAIALAVAPDVVLFHVHDNFGARLDGEGGATHDPLRLDLHLAPGSGSLPWESVRPALLAHPAPLLLEVHPAHRPQPATLHDIAVSVIGGREAPDQEMAPDAVSARTTVPSASR